MGKTFETIINKFDGGLVNDPRARVANSCSLCKNFDASTNPNRLTPYADSESGDTAPTTSQKQNFAIGLRDNSSPTAPVHSLYSLGFVSGTGKAEVLYKNLTTGAATDLDDDGWSTPSNNQSASGTTSLSTFVYYGKTGKIYGIRANRYVWAFDTQGAAFADSEADLTTAYFPAEGLVHSKDDILYIPYDNKIASFDSSTWTTAAITIPNHLKITSICEYGNFIAIAATPRNNIGKTFVYLWNRDSTLTTLTESIEWGTGQLQVLEEIEGLLVGISIYAGTTRARDRIIFRYYGGGSPKTFMEYQADSATTSVLTKSKQKIDERLYFMMTITKDGVLREGVWSVFLKDGKLSIVHERTPNNDTETTNGVLKGFIKIGDFLFQSFIDNASYDLTKTNDQSSYTHSSVYRTNINPNIDTGYMSRKKQLVAVSMNYAALPTAGSAKLEYRVDGGSWVEIFTETTDSAINTESVIDVNGAQFESGREYEFRITSTGGAEVTELKYKWALLDTQL